MTQPALDDRPARHLSLFVRRSAAITIVLIATGSLPIAQTGSWIAAELTRVRLGGDGEMPKIQSQVLPDYPADATLHTTVDIEVVVGTKGAVLQARATSADDQAAATGRAVFERAAIDAARAWTFKPATTMMGDRIPVLMLLQFEFAPPRAIGQPGQVAARLSGVPLAPLPDVGQRVSVDTALALENGGAKALGVQWPKVVRQVLPSYTPNAMRAKITGKVSLEIVILADGSVGQTRVTRTLHKELDQMALIAARYWLFEPGTKDGRPVATKVALDLEFQLH